MNNNEVEKNKDLDVMPELAIEHEPQSFCSVISREEIINAMPDKKRSLVTTSIVEAINKINNDPDFHPDEFVDNFMHFGAVLAGTRYSMRQYLDAVRFTTLLMGGDTIRSAYEKTFPEILARRIADGRAESTMQSASVIYHQNKLVQKIIMQSQIPMRLLYGKAKIDALNVLISKSTDPTAGHRINMESANMILTHLKDPDESKITLQQDIGDNAKDAISELRDAASALVQAELKSLSNGTPLKEIAERNIVINQES